MTPMLASPDVSGFTEFIKAYCFLIFAAALTVTALMLAIPRRTQIVSGRLATGCVIYWSVSGFAVLVNVESIHSGGDVFLGCVLTVVAAAVFYSERRLLRRHGGVT
jgi:hypothetical protein